MPVSVFDTYVKKSNGDTLHFDIIIPEGKYNHEEVLAFEAGLTKLGTCPQIASFHWGIPAPTEKREVVEHSYDYAISVQFESLDLQNAYQEEAIHHEFIKNHQDIWEKVVVYDSEVKG